jgi:hypothetical protein
MQYVLLVLSYLQVALVTVINKNGVDIVN